MELRGKYYLLLTGFFAILTSCSSDLHTKYAVQLVRVSETHEVYFKRKVRGQNYDVTVLSANKNHCAIPDPKSDYVFNGLDDSPILFYKVENSTLILFLTIPAKEPEGGQFPIKVVQIKVEPLENWKMKEKYGDMGLKPLELEIDNSLKCR